MAIFS